MRLDVSNLQAEIFKLRCLNDSFERGRCCTWFLSWRSKSYIVCFTVESNFKNSQTLESGRHKSIPLFWLVGLIKLERHGPDFIYIEPDLRLGNPESINAIEDRLAYLAGIHSNEVIIYTICELKTRSNDGYFRSESDQPNASARATNKLLKMVAPLKR